MDNYVIDECHFGEDDNPTKATANKNLKIDESIFNPFDSHIKNVEKKSEASHSQK